jgi:hypothetical protein
METRAQVPALQTENAVMISKSLFMDMQRFEAAQRVATLLASSSLVPQHFQKSVANCVIALNLADRLQVDPFMLMQNIYVVHGRPGIEGKLAIALVEGTGRFSPLKFRMAGQGKTSKGVARADGCVAYATELKTGEAIEGPPVTWEMAEAEGWTKPKGTETSKWQTMPDLMFRYRSAMFFARVNCPGALLGLRSSDEIEDIEMVENKRGTFASTIGNPTREDREISDNTCALKAFAETIPPGTDTEILEAFIVVCAKHNNTDADGVKIEAAKNPGSFWKPYVAWEKVEKAKRKKESLPMKDATGEDVKMSGDCPKAPGNTYKESYCAAGCPERAGCPAWQE